MTPLIELVLISLGITSISQAVYFFMVDQDYVERTREEIRELTKKLREVSPNSKEYKTLLNKQLKLNMEMTKHTFKPNLVTIVPYIAMFSLLKKRYEGIPMINLPFKLFGKYYIGWIGTFILVSLVTTTIIQAVVKYYRKKKKGDENA